MLELLETIAASLGLPFCYGAVSDLNIQADKLASKTDKLLFHEGYLSGTLSKDAQGAYSPNYDLRLWIMMRSDLADLPLTHKARLMVMKQVMYQILNRLEETEGIEAVTALRFEEGVKMKATDNPLDGIRLYGSVKVDEDTLCL
ncbi:hypothetical protein GCM10028803_00460 [Larkinella knui]|uniref:DUF3168 domain-containing protein n=1 Tax=Larkinella knui TaxID=2025310 RepID=A0A3P1CJS8_9BACT|nr:hypothetical protein [Larkinella knui]RRB13450.1 hypothetical protein EHT87_14330 [Larkinella knui]